MSNLYLYNGKDWIEIAKNGYTPIKGTDYDDGYTPVKGVDYFDGENGSPDTAEEVRNKLESLKGDNRISETSIKGLELIIKKPQLDRAVSILDERTQFLINKVSNLKIDIDNITGSDVTGSGSAGQVTYWSGTDTVTGSAGFTWGDGNREITLSNTNNTGWIRAQSAGDFNIIASTSNSEGLVIGRGATSALGGTRNTINFDKNGHIIFNTGSSSSAERVRISSTGTVGIMSDSSVNTTSRNFTLNFGASNAATFGFYQDGSEKVTLRGTSTGRFDFDTGGATRWNIASSGNTAIGNNNVEETLARMGVYGASLTGSASTGILRLTQTWNTTGTPTALFMDITNTASNAASLLMDLQVGASSRFKVDHAGALTLGDGTTSVIYANAATTSSNQTILVQAATANLTTTLDIRPNGSSTTPTALFLRNNSAASNGSALLTLGTGAATVPSSSVWYISSLVSGQTDSPSFPISFLLSKNSASGRYAAWTINNAGTVSQTPAALAGSEATSALDIAQTWNTSGVTTAFKLNITNTASGSGSLLTDLQTSGTSRFKVGVVNGTSIASSIASGGVYSLAVTNTPSFSTTSNTQGILSLTGTLASGAGSGVFNPLSIVYTINNSGAQTGTANGIFLNATETALNSITHNLMDLQVGGTSKFKVSNGGVANASSTFQLAGSSDSQWTADEMRFNGTSNIISRGGGSIYLKNSNSTHGFFVSSTASGSYAAMMANSTEILKVISAGDVQLAEAADFVLGTTTGTKIGTATTQKLGFFNATPVVQQATITAYTNTGIYATDAAGIKTAIDEIKARLTALGLTA